MTCNPERVGKTRRSFVALTLLSILALLFVLAGNGGVARAETGEARMALARSLALLKKGDSTGARSQAMKAVKAADGWGLAHGVLARAQLDLGDGIAAEAELDRAVAAGLDRARVQQLYADAYLLQGDPARALATLEKADSRYARYTLAVRGRALQAQGDLAGARAAFEDAVVRYPASSDAWQALAQFRFDIGDMVGAINAAGEALSRNPDNIDALILRGQLVRQQYGLTAALPWFESALAHDQWRFDALIEYAATLGDVGRTRDMLAAVRKAMLVRPGAPQGYYLQSVLAARAGDYDVARSVLARAGDALSRMPGAMLLSGSLDLQQGDYAQAVTSLNDLVTVQPMNLTARKLLALAFLRSGDTASARRVLTPMVARADADSYTLALAARAYERDGDRATAARFLDRAALPAVAGSTSFTADDDLKLLDIDAANAPDAPGAVVPLIRGMLQAGQSAQALARAQKMAADNPGAPEARLMIGDVLAATGKWDDAAAAYRDAASVRFDEATMLRMVDALDRDGHRDRAQQVLALFLQQNPANVAALRLAGHWQIAAGDFAAAVVTLEGLRFRLGDRDAALLAELAVAHSGLGEDDMAMQYGAAAYALAPGNPAVADAYGWSAFQAGFQTAALQLLGKAVALAPDHSGLRWHYAQALAAGGDKAAAARNTKAALGDPGFADRDAAKDLLARLV
ncbi:tetratricopeptide repeat protein [Stakelama sp. CBK3Z-3]|uniref:Tetratricopeptide repeat protein n=1 Tax=Stakelama flava TaxID=2860338 RepID=A0ABS6XKR5_9SPHN|nr:tetratricopeptide repeat protein [Stakelama flava]MBW4330000.1 tetratricopeptide repeat protein [Stakelama flava]